MFSFIFSYSHKVRDLSVTCPKHTHLGQVLLLLIILLVVPFVSSEVIVDDVVIGSGNSLGVDIMVPIPPINFSTISVNHSNITDSWQTDIGILTSVNSTQFSNNGGFLNILESFLSSFGNNIWCELTGCEMQGDIQMNGNDLTEIDFLNATNIRAVVGNFTDLFVSNATLFIGNVSISESNNVLQIQEGKTINASFLTGDGSGLFNLDFNQSNGSAEFVNVTANNFFGGNFFGIYDWIAQSPFLIFNGTFLQFNESALDSGFLKLDGSNADQNIDITPFNLTLNSLSAGGELNVTGNINANATYSVNNQPSYNPIDDNLLLYMPFTDNGSSIQYDRSKFGHDGTPSLGIDCLGIYGQIGNGCNFNGSGYITVIGEGGAFSVNEFTIEAWIFRSIDTGGTETIIDNRDSINDGWLLRITTSDTFQCDYVGVDIPSSTTIAVGQWYHVACVADGTNVKVYVNGLEENSVAQVGSISETTDVRIGARSHTSPANFWNGNIDELMIFSRPLRQEEIREQYLSGLNATLKPYIQQNGNVGIGTTSPTQKLDVKGSINISGVYYGNGSGLTGASLWTNSSGDATYVAGNVGIGTTSPTANLDIEADSLTTGSALHVHSDSNDTQTRNVVILHNDNVLADGATVLRISQDADQQALFIDGVGPETNDVVHITANALTTGSALHVVSASSDTGTRNIVNIHQDSTTATGATALRIQQDSNSPALTVDQQGGGSIVANIGFSGSSSSERNVLELTNTNFNAANTKLLQLIQSSRDWALDAQADALTNLGGIARFQSNSTNAFTRNLVEIINDNILATGTTAFYIQQDSTGDIINLFDGLTEVFTVLDGGNVGIGTTTPTQKLDVNGSVNVNGDINITNNSILDIFSLNFSNGDSIIGNNSISINVDNITRVLFGQIDTRFTGDVKNIDDIDGLSRFSETNINNGTNAIAGFTAANNIGESIFMGITGENFNASEVIQGSGLGGLFLNANQSMFFSMGFNNGYDWLNNPTDDGDFINSTNILMSLSENGDLTVSNTVFAGDVNSQGLFDRIDNVTQIDFDVIFDLTLPVLYAADTTNNEITINITFGTNASFQVWDAERKFNQNSVFVNILNSDGVTIDHFVELNTRNKAYQFFFNGTVWFYGEIGKGQFVAIASEHTSIVDFGNLIQENDNNSEITVIGSLEFTGVGIGSQKIISLVPTSELESNANWKGVFIDGDLLDPTGEGADIVGFEVDFSNLNTTNTPVLHGVEITVPPRFDAMHIHEGQLVIDNQPTSTETTEFSAMDIRVDTVNLDSTSVWSAMGVTAVGNSTGTVAAVLARNQVQPIRQEVGTFTTPSQTGFAGRKTGGGITWVDGIDGDEIFIELGDEVFIGSSSQFSQIEVIMGTVANKDVQPTFWYNTAADNWTEFFPDDETSGFQTSSLISWEPDSISALWTSNGDPSVGNTTTGYWIKIIRIRVEDPGTPIPTTMKTGTVETFGWDQFGVLTIMDLIITDSFITEGNLTIGEKITFAFGEIIDNIVDGWIRINGNLNVTGSSGLTVGTITGSGTNGVLDLKGVGGGANSIGGDVRIAGGFGLTTPGKVSITAGSTNSIGTDVTISGGDGPTGKSGGVNLLGGTSGDDNGEGGDILIRGGQGGVVTGAGGDVTIQSGDSEGVLPGILTLKGGEQIGFSVFGDIIMQEDGGDIGVGLNTPLEKLHINGTIQVGDGSTQQFIILTSPNGTEYSCGVANGGTFTCT